MSYLDHSIFAEVKREELIKMMSLWVFGNNVDTQCRKVLSISTTLSAQWIFIH